MQAQLLLGVPSDKFIDINTIEHVFPEEIKNIGFPVTLLHNYPHAPVNSLLGQWSSSLFKLALNSKSNVNYLVNPFIVVPLVSTFYF